MTDDPTAADRSADAHPARAPSAGAPSASVPQARHAPAAISLLPVDGFDARLDDLSGLLHACVLAGASVNFILPFEPAEARAFWQRKIRPGLSAGTRLLLLAECGGVLAGSVQLDTGTPPNQAHRAEVSKLLVHPDFRRRGIARLLMTELERHAHRVGRSLLTLDTRTGDHAEPLYLSMGYRTVGVIPDYCRNTIEDHLDSTTIMYKRL